MILAIFGILASLMLPARGRRILTEEDLGITDDWKPGLDHDRQPNASCLATDTTLVGKWTGPSVFVTITRAGPNQYSVDFKTGAECRGCRLKRSAEYRDGVITLDRPVKGIMGPIYQRMYSIRFEEREYLLPAPNVSEFEVRASTRLEMIALRRWRGPFGNE